MLFESCQIWSLTDHRVDDLYLLKSVWHPISITAVYLLLVLKILPKFMEGRQPYNVKKLVIAYDFFQIILNYWMLHMGLPRILRQENIPCIEVNYSDSYDGRRDLFICYIYYITKILDLMDTIFIVLKKNYRQVTLLHVYHHSGMVIFTWFTVRYAGVGPSMWTGLFNCTVHMIMYCYYMVTAFDESTKRILIVKKSITLMQMVQFLCIMTVYGWLLYHGCGYPRICSVLIVSNAIIMLILFTNFYLKTYTTKICQLEKSATGRNRNLNEMPSTRSETRMNDKMK